jgi:hypothetical protein
MKRLPAFGFLILAIPGGFVLSHTAPTKKIRTMRPTMKAYNAQKSLGAQNRSRYGTHLIEGSAFFTFIRKNMAQDPCLTMTMITAQALSPITGLHKDILFQACSIRITLNRPLGCMMILVALLTIPSDKETASTNELPRSRATRNSFD